MKTIWHSLKIRVATARQYLCAKIPPRRGTAVVVALSLWMVCGGICGSQGLPQPSTESPVSSFGEIHWYIFPYEQEPLPMAEVLAIVIVEISE